MNVSLNIKKIPKQVHVMNDQRGVLRWGEDHFQIWDFFLE
jgi:hypothetical protein